MVARRADGRSAALRWAALAILTLVTGCVSGTAPTRSPVASIDATPTPAALDDPRLSDDLRSELRRLAASLERFRDQEVADAEGYRRAQGCIDGAGSHWMNDALVDDPAVDPLEPEALMYDGDGELVGVEYFVYADNPRPELFGWAMDGPFTVRGILPEQIWWRHVWLYRTSRDGMFALSNANVDC